MLLPLGHAVPLPILPAARAQILSRIGGSGLPPVLVRQLVVRDVVAGRDPSLCEARRHVRGAGAGTHLLHRRLARLHRRRVHGLGLLAWSADGVGHPFFFYLLPPRLSAGMLGAAGPVGWRMAV
jgi:hypothetical protein